MRWANTSRDQPAYLGIALGLNGAELRGGVDGPPVAGAGHVYGNRAVGELERDCLDGEDAPGIAAVEETYLEGLLAGVRQ